MASDADDTAAGEPSAEEWARRLWWSIKDDVETYSRTPLAREQVIIKTIAAALHERLRAAEAERDSMRLLLDTVYECERGLIAERDKANTQLARLREPDEAMVRDAVDAMKYEMTLVAMARAALRAAAAELELESKP